MSGNDPVTERFLPSRGGGKQNRTDDDQARRLLENLVASGDIDLDSADKDLHQPHTAAAASAKALKETVTEMIESHGSRTEPFLQNQRTQDDDETIITFPYSRHSSYAEQCHLVDAFKPRDVWPCTADFKEWSENGQSYAPPPPFLLLFLYTRFVTHKEYVLTEGNRHEYQRPVRSVLLRIRPRLRPGRGAVRPRKPEARRRVSTRRRRRVPAQGRFFPYPSNPADKSPPPPVTPNQLPSRGTFTRPEYTALRVRHFPRKPNRIISHPAVSSGSSSNGQLQPRGVSTPLSTQRPATFTRRRRRRRRIRIRPPRRSPRPRRRARRVVAPGRLLEHADGRVLRRAAQRGRRGPEPDIHQATRARHRVVAPQLGYAKRERERERMLLL